MRLTTDMSCRTIVIYSICWRVMPIFSLYLLLLRQCLRRKIDVKSFFRYLYGYMAKGYDRIAANINHVAAHGSLQQGTHIDEITVISLIFVQSLSELRRRPLSVAATLHVPAHGLADGRSQTSGRNFGRASAAAKEQCSRHEKRSRRH